LQCYGSHNGRRHLLVCVTGVTQSNKKPSHFIKKTTKSVREALWEMRQGKSIPNYQMSNPLAHPAIRLIPAACEATLAA